VAAGARIDELLSLVPRKLRGLWGFDNLRKENTQGLYHLAIPPIFQPAAHGLSAKVRSQILCCVLFETKSLGSLDETLGPLDAPLGYFAEVVGNIQDAIRGYLEGLKKHNEPVPPSIEEEIVEVAM
jgi:hypothetical protein